MTQPRNFPISRLYFCPSRKHQHSCSSWTDLGLYFFYKFSAMILMHHLKLESSNLEFKRPSYGQNNNMGFRKKNFDNNFLQNLYIYFYTSWSLRPHKPKKKKTIQRNTTPIQEQITQRWKSYVLPKHKNENELGLS